MARRRPLGPVAESCSTWKDVPFSHGSIRSMSCQVNGTRVKFQAFRGPQGWRGVFWAGKSGVYMEDRRFKSLKQLERTLRAKARRAVGG